MLFAIIGLLAGAGPLAAQPGSENPIADILSGRPARATLLAPGEAMEAYGTARAWIDAWAIGDEGGNPPVGAVRAVLRHRGLVVGWGEVVAEASSEAGALRDALGPALDQGKRALVPRGGALGSELLSSLGDEVRLSLELAGPLTPLGRTELLNPESMMRPGLDGLAVRVGDEWLAAFPSELIASDAGVAVRMQAMAAELLDDPTLGVALLVDLASVHGATFYRFETVHIAGIGRSGAPVFLTRGHRVVERREITSRGLSEFADSMVGHFEQSLDANRAPFGLLGTYNLARGKAEERGALPTQQALASLALARAARTPSLDPSTRERALETAARILAELGEVDGSEIPPRNDGVAAAIIAVVWGELDALLPEVLADHEVGKVRDLGQACAAMLEAHADAPRGEPEGTIAEAVLAWALAERAVQTGEGREVAEREVRALYQATSPGGLVGLAPWIGWAELALAREKERVPAAAALRELRDMVWAHQLTLEDTGREEQDLLGGIVFTSRGPGLPTWNSARPIALMATMLGDPRLTSGDEVAKQLMPMLDAMRFLRQLAADEVVVASSPRPELATGGVRAAAWSSRQPPEATALSLLAVCEFLDSSSRVMAVSETGSGEP